MLGRLEHDEDRNTYSGEISSRQQKVMIHLKPDERGDFARAEERAIRFARDSRLELESITRYLAGHFLDMANEDWADPQRDALNVATFIERLRVDTVAFGGDGGVTYHFTAGDIFGDHGLIARMRHDGILFDAELAG